MNPYVFISTITGPLCGRMGGNMTDYNNRYSPREDDPRQGYTSTSPRQKSYFRSSYWQNRNDDLSGERYDSYPRSVRDDGYSGRDRRDAYRSYQDDSYGYAPRQSRDRYSDDYGRQDYGYAENTRRSGYGYADDYAGSRYGTSGRAGQRSYGYADAYPQTDYVDVGYGREDLKRRGAIVFGTLAFIVLAVVVLIIMLVRLNAEVTINPAPAAQPAATAAATPVAVPTEMPVETPAAVPTETPASTPAPATAASMAPLSEYTVLTGIPDTDRALGLPETAQVPDSYFDDAVFIGDSVTLKLNYFVRDKRSEYPTLLGNAQFLTAGSLGSGNALREVSSDSLHPSYQGQKMAIEDAVAAMGAKKVYIMLGMNDVALYGVEESAENMMRLLARIASKSPGVQIFVQSATPRIEGDYNKLNNDALFQYNLKLYEYCLQYSSNGIYFVDVADVMRDEKGNLPLDYCSDATGMGLHFTDKACKIWIEYLYTHALAQ